MVDARQGWARFTNSRTGLNTERDYHHVLLVNQIAVESGAGDTNQVLNKLKKWLEV